MAFWFGTHWSGRHQEKVKKLIYFYLSNIYGGALNGPAIDMQHQEVNSFFL